jgi:hypothetical protein
MTKALFDNMTAPGSAVSPGSLVEPPKIRPLADEMLYGRSLADNQILTVRSLAGLTLT